MDTYESLILLPIYYLGFGTVTKTLLFSILLFGEYKNVSHRNVHTTLDTFNYL